MNITEEHLTKEFVVKGFTVNDEPVTISRGDYECMPCPMCTEDFTDERMEELADNISKELSQWNFPVNSPYREESKEDAFWKEMEECAVHMGMRYYEDMDDPDEEEKS